jgi:molybdopterin synthase sulfur carrier subunit
MLRIQFYSLLRLLIKQERVDIPWQEGDTVKQVLERVQGSIDTPFLPELVDEREELHAGTIILVNRRNVLHLDGLKTEVRENDVLALFPPGAGG